MDGDNFYDEEDLVVASTSNRNWKGIIIAVLVIASILSLIVTAVVLLTPPEEGPRIKGRRVELDDVFGLSAIGLNGSWVDDKHWAFRDYNGGASVLNVENRTTKQIIRSTSFDLDNANSFTLSPDGKYALLAHDVKKTHRYSTTAKYTILDIESDTPTPLNLNGLSRFQLAEWGPGSSLFLVSANDIWVRESNGKSTRITQDGIDGLIYNGIPDWIYEEELWPSASALWPSPDGLKILYLSFNDSAVGQTHILEYGRVEDFVYPKVKSIRYPKPGTTNPTVTVTVADLRGNKLRMIPPSEFSGDHYVTWAGWVTNAQVGVVWTSRNFHTALVSICDVRTGECEEEYRLAPSPKTGWLHPPTPTFSTNTNFLTTASVRDGEKGFFEHLVFVDTQNGRSHPITHGNFDVLKVAAWDEDSGVVYFTATPSTTPAERHLYKIKLTADASPECITCQFSPTTTDAAGAAVTNPDVTFYSPDLRSGPPQRTTQTSKKNLTKQTKKEQKEDKEREREKYEKIKVNPPFSTLPSFAARNSTCTYVLNVKFSPGYKFFVLECGGPSVPFAGVYNVDLELVEILQRNDQLINSTSNLALPQIRIFPVHLASGVSAQVKLLLPPGLREDEITQYPLILNVFGSPGSQLATDKWSLDFPTYLSSRRDYIVAQIDGRGSGGRGWDFQHSVFYNLGHLETLDQMEVVRHLRDSLPYVETNKIGIWGWGYGGYLTASIMTSKDTTDLFQCGASIAPVVKWSLYDSPFSEKYMGTPNVTDNYKGYTHTDLTRNIESLNKKAFYLIHGTGDEQVHVGHSMLLAKALIEKKILFRQQIYPDENHSLDGAKFHVHSSLDEFFEDCFRRQIAPEVETLSKGGKFDDFD